jgi:ATP-binding cassette subfamily C protein
MAKPGNAVLHDTLGACVNGVLWAAFFGLFVNAFQLTVPLYMLQVYDRVINSHSIDTLVMLTVLALGCLLFLACIDIVRARVFIVIGEILAHRLSVPTLQAAMVQALRSSASQSSQPMRDLQELRQFVTGGPIALPIDALFAPLFLIVLFVLHPAYGAVALASAVLLIGLSVAMEIVVRRPAQDANEAALRAHAEVGAAIRHAEIIESMGMLGAVARRWHADQSRAVHKVGARTAGMRAVVATSRAVRMAVQICMLATGAVLVIDRAVSPGTIVAATIIMSRVLMPFEQLVDGWRHWAHVIEAWRRLKILLVESGAVRQARPMAVTEGRLAVDRLGFVPAGTDRAVIKGVSFTLEPGEVLGIIGPSGAGKSTLARLLVGVWPPTTGGVFVDGHNAYTWERESFGRSIGYMPQFAALLDGTVGENIARLGEAGSAEVVAAARLVGAHEMIGRLPLGYETRVGEGGHALSGGQRQRIALARAFFGNPRLVVLDEPNSHLDAEGEAAMLAAVRAARDGGATVIIIAHKPSLVEAADNILVLRDGAVDSFGPRRPALEPAAAQPALPASAGTNVTPLPVRRFGAP